MSNERGPIDLLSRVSTTYENNNDNATTNADQALAQEKALAKGEMHIGKKEEHIGRSFLSPENEFNKQAGEVVNKDNYISPGSKEYSDYINKLDEEYEEDTSEAVSSNRIQAYIILAVVLYFLALVVGYHYTTFEDDVPQVTSTEKIEASEYLSQINDYIMAVEILHNETVDAIESYTNETMGASELASLMKKSNEKIEKQQEEIKDIIPPEGYDTFHSALIELFSLEASLNNAAISYASSGRSVQEFEVVSNINNKYTDAAGEFFINFNKSFY